MRKYIGNVVFLILLAGLFSCNSSSKTQSNQSLEWPQGKPLWGTVDPEYNECPPGANADCNGQPAPYRICCSSFTWVGQALAARLMGAVDLWNHPAYFDYVDRWVGEPNSWWYGDTPTYGAIYGFGGQFVRDMWTTYRNSLGNPPQSNQPPPPPDPILSYNTPQRSVSQNGITWTFDRDYPAGQFYLGDWWVVGPVTIVSVSPGWNGQIGVNGSMIDPDASTDTQGYRVGLDVPYFDSLNVATRLSSLTPLTIDPAQGSQGVVSLISSIGLDPIASGGSHEGIRSAAVLTVVSGVPPSDAFRPAYARGDKTIYRTSQMNTNLLPGLPAPGSISGALSLYGNAFTKVYLDHGYYGGNGGASLHPVDNGFPYGRDFSTAVSNAALIALTNDSQAVEFARRLTQMGIDFYPMWLVNNKGIEGSGFGWGYKWPILFAGIMLNNYGMQHPPLYRTGTTNKFPEDRWTSYGTPK